MPLWEQPFLSLISKVDSKQSLIYTSSRSRATLSFIWSCVHVTWWKSDIHSLLVVSSLSSEISSSLPASVCHLRARQLNNQLKVAVMLQIQVKNVFRFITMSDTFTMWQRLRLHAPACTHAYSNQEPPSFICSITHLKRSALRYLHIFYMKMLDRQCRADHKQARGCVSQTAVKKTETHILNVLFKCPKFAPKTWIISTYHTC